MRPLEVYAPLADGELQTYREALSQSVETGGTVGRASQHELVRAARFDRVAPSHYTEIPRDGNEPLSLSPLLDSVHAYLNKPSPVERRQNPRVTWAEFFIDPTISIVVPNPDYDLSLSVSDSNFHIEQELWKRSFKLDRFLGRFKPIITKPLEPQGWLHLRTDEVYERPMVLAPTEAIIDWTIRELDNPLV